MTLMILICIGLLIAAVATALLNYKIPATSLTVLALPPLLAVMPVVKAVFVWLALLSLVFMMLVILWGLIKA